MILVDANLLVYALHADLPQHQAAKAWFERAVMGQEPLALCWMVILAVIRLSTNNRLFPQALSAGQAVAVVESWLGHPGVVVIGPGEAHWPILSGLLGTLGEAGNLTPDAHLAALAIEHGAVIFSADNDFRRFPGLRVCNPLV